MKISVKSETGLLQGVVVHTPGNEVSLVNPDLKDELLFDDIIYEEDARREHLAMLDIFRVVMPQKDSIYEILDLAKSIFEQEEARHHFLEKLHEAQPEFNLEPVISDLKKLEPNELLEFIIAGTADAIPTFNLNPSPNLLFTRDLAATVPDGMILSRAARQARIRESVMMETIMEYHPMFANMKEQAIRIGSQESIEGGDVLVASSKLVLIGMSERTTFSGILKASRELLKGSVETVLVVDIPKQRSSMHLDTIFTFCTDHECITFPPAIDDRVDNVVALELMDDHVITTAKSSLKNALEEYLGHQMTFIPCGGHNPTNQFREQWTDGANVFALAPGVIVGYNRNTNTFEALRKEGYEIMNQYDFINSYGRSRFTPDPDVKIAISFEGSELCRGRGGARCMTMPLNRS